MTDRELALILGIDEGLIEKVSWEPRPAAPAPSAADIEEAAVVLEALDERIRASAAAPARLVRGDA